MNKYIVNVYVYFSYLRYTLTELSAHLRNFFRLLQPKIHTHTHRTVKPQDFLPPKKVKLVRSTGRVMTSIF